LLFNADAQGIADDKRSEDCYPEPAPFTRTRQSAKKFSLFAIFKQNSMEKEIRECLLECLLEC
jgi:hypothetical protein